MTDELVSLYAKLNEERERSYQAKRKGGIAWRQHCATIRNINRRINNLIWKNTSR